MPGRLRLPPQLAKVRLVQKVADDTRCSVRALHAQLRHQSSSLHSSDVAVKNTVKMDQDNHMTDLRNQGHRPVPGSANRFYHCWYDVEAGDHSMLSTLTTAASVWPSDRHLEQGLTKLKARSTCF